MGKFKSLIRRTIIYLSNFSLLFMNKFSETKFRNQLLRFIGFDIGSPVIIDRNFQFADPHTIKIGNNVLIRENCVLDHNITIEDYCTLSRDVMILSAGHNPVDMSYVAKPVILKKFCWVGARATIMSGVSIGEFSVVAAGSVVTKDVPPHSLVGGVPARVIRTLEKPKVYHSQFAEVHLEG